MTCRLNLTLLADLQLHVIAKRGNKGKEIAGRNRSPGYCMKSCELRKTLSVETFCFPGKRLL